MDKFTIWRDESSSAAILSWMLWHIDNRDHRSLWNAKSQPLSHYPKSEKRKLVSVLELSTLIVEITQIWMLEIGGIVKLVWIKILNPLAHIYSTRHFGHLT